MSPYAIERIRRERKAGKSLAAIANGLNADRIPTDAQAGRVRFGPGRVLREVRRRAGPCQSSSALFVAVAFDPLESTRGSAEFVLDTPLVRAFVAGVQATIGDASSPDEACEEIRPRFAALLADPDWLPAEYQAAAPESGMGGGIGRWLLYRTAHGSLSLFSLVVPPASETPIHDHLAWGLVGLYRGRQEEEIYVEGNGALELVERRSLNPGDFYVLIPPRDDIHRVRTTSAETSVSIHLLTNDTGCVWRHAYDPASGGARPFRSGYVNVACEDGAEQR